MMVSRPSNIRTIQDYQPAEDSDKMVRNPSGYMMDRKKDGGIHTVNDFKDTYKMVLKMKPLSDSNVKTIDTL